MRSTTTCARVLGGCVAVLSASALGACDKSPFEADRPISDPAPSLQAPATMALDGGIAIERADPSPPAGDLREDVARFTTLDTCVAQHAVLDPLVGDAVRSIGYDTLLRDACRILQALKLKDSSPCTAITASGLQRRCETLLAIALKDPEKCPWSVPTEKRLGRDATCLAVSTRDARSCAAEQEMTQPACEALASGDVSRCGRATGDERATCARDLERLHTLLEGEHPAHDSARPSAHLEVHGAKGTADPAVTELDLSSTVSGGAVVAAEPAGGAGIELARDTEAILGLPMRVERAHFAAKIVFEAGSPTLVKLSVTAPKIPEIACPSAHCSMKVTMPKSESQRGAPLSATFEGSVETTAGTYQVQLRVDTFVRDVVGRSAIYGGR